MLPQTSFLKYNLWRPLDHLMVYYSLLKLASILYKIRLELPFVKTLTETDKDVAGYVNLLDLNVK